MRRGDILPCIVPSMLASNEFAISHLHRFRMKCNAMCSAFMSRMEPVAGFRRPIPVPLNYISCGVLRLVSLPPGRHLENWARLSLHQPEELWGACCTAHPRTGKSPIPHAHIEKGVHYRKTPTTTIGCFLACAALHAVD